jgi:predicted nucleic acid-binding protein
MSDRLFIDTNIFLYTFDPAVPEKARHCENLIASSLENRNGVISFQVVQEFLNAAFRRLSPPLTLAAAEQYLAMTLRPLLVVQSSYSLYAQALTLLGRYSLSWYDSLIVAAAIESGCRILYTEDLQHNQKFGDLIVKSPFL